MGQSFEVLLAQEISAAAGGPAASFGAGESVPVWPLDWRRWRKRMTTTSLSGRFLEWCYCEKRNEPEMAVLSDGDVVSVNLTRRRMTSGAADGGVDGD